MIHCRAQAPTIQSPEPTLHISLTTREEIAKFLELLNRSLNCAPEFGDDWFVLSDKIDSFLNSSTPR